jgi:anti-sigma factor RsiW
MTECRDIQDRLSQFVDGELTADEHADVAAHVASCALCRGLAHDLERLRQAVAGLGSSAPPDHVWLEVAGRIRLEQPARSRAPEAPRRSALGQWIGLAAALVLLTFATYYLSRAPAAPPEATVAGNAAPGGSVQVIADELSLAMQHYEKAIAELQAMAQADDDPVDLAVATQLRDNIRMIDAAIAESRQAVQSDPASEPARESLFEALRQKVIVLQATVTLMNEMRKGNQAGAAEAAAAFGKKS